MRETQKKDGKSLYNFDYESKEEKKLRERKLKEKRLKEREMKQQALKNKKMEVTESKKSKADERKSASAKRKSSNSNEKNGQASSKKKYDDEIIIGVTTVPEKNNIKSSKSKKNDTKKLEPQNKENNRHHEKIKTKKDYKKNNEKKKNHIDNSYIIDEQEPKIKKKKSKKSIKIIKLLLLILIIVVAGIFAMLSPIFNLKNIEITGNNEVTNEQIISLSGIQLEENIFRINKLKIIKNIKQNAYVNDVEIHKKLPDTLSITIQERHPSYILEYGNGYVYINNQGYMLEISSIKINVPILEGVVTSKEDYKEGNRLDEEDLIKLGTVIKIMDLAQNNKISELITKIDIRDENNYTLYFESEGKTAYLGDCSNLETRMLYLVGILEREKNNSGEIFINMNLNTDDAYFRESI